MHLHGQRIRIHDGLPAAPSVSTWSGKPSKRGADVYTVVGLPLAEAVTGIKKTILVNVMGQCPSCQVDNAAEQLIATRH